MGELKIRQDNKIGPGVPIKTIMPIKHPRPKPAYGRQGLEGGMVGHDTDQAITFWGVLNVSLQLGLKPTWNQE